MTTEVGAETSADQALNGDVESGCSNCGEPLAGDYCFSCGEKQPAARDLSVRHFLGETLQELTSVEHSKVYRTLRALLFKPGHLSTEYFAGRRGRYLKPLSLCLAIFALNIFAYSTTKKVTMFNFEPLIQTENDYLAASGIQKRGIYERLVERISRTRNLSREATIDAINERWSRNFSLLQVPEIVLFSLLLAAVYFFSGRYLVEHLVFSLHFLAFTSLTTVILWPLYFVIGIKPTTFNMVLGALKFLLDIVYLFFAVRAFYRERFWIALLKAPFLFLGYFVIYIIMFLTALAMTLLTLATA